MNRAMIRKFFPDLIYSIFSVSSPKWNEDPSKFGMESPISYTWKKRKANVVNRLKRPIRSSRWIERARSKLHDAISSATK